MVNHNYFTLPANFIQTIGYISIINSSLSYCNHFFIFFVIHSNVPNKATNQALSLNLWPYSAYLLNHYFTVQCRKHFILLFCSTFRIDIHSCRKICMTHYRLDYLNIRFILTKTRTKCMSQIMA